jgi:hypothetical protein
METLTLEQLAAAPIISQLKSPGFTVEPGGKLSLGGLSYEPPNGGPDIEASVVWAKLIESLHSANELSRLASALAEA